MRMTSYSIVIYTIKYAKLVAYMCLKIQTYCKMIQSNTQKICFIYNLNASLKFQINLKTLKF